VTPKCPNCGENTPAGAAFCEACGAKLAPTGSKDRRPWLIPVAGVVLLLGALAGAYFVGADVGDDSSDVDRLEEQVAELTDERDELADRAESAEEEAAELQEQVEDLNDRLEAELGLSGEETTQRDDAVSAADADLRLGEAGQVGDLILRPTSFVKTGEGAEAATWVATISAKNDGSEPLNPFCGGAEAEVEDSDGRKFGGDSIIGNTRNCGNDLQPGLTADDYKLRFKLPKEAQPVLLRLGDEFTFNRPERKTWAVG
jgi:hypothetical protein